MKRELTAADRDKIIQAIKAGDRIEATSIYITITRCGLSEAQTFIKALTAGVNAIKPEEMQRK